MPETLLTIDLAAIQANYATLRANAHGREVAGVVKADAYGLGADQVAPALWRAGCRTFFTAKLGEARKLRAILPKAVIHVLEGVTPEETKAFIEADIIPVLGQPGELGHWRAAAKAAGRRLKAGIQLETGLSRLGFTRADLLTLPQGWTEDIELSLVMSHLACADEPEHPQNARQLESFKALSALLPEARRSLANSSGVFLDPAFAFDLVRPGAALYGINPTPGRPNPMRPVVTIKAPVLRVQHLDAPALVGYGATRELAKGAKIATIGVGYADGLIRSASNAAKASIGGRVVPIVGRISMDLTMLDVSGLEDEEVKVGTIVELFGRAFDLDAVATAAGTIGYELLTRLGQRFHRVYLGQDSA